MTLVSRAEFLTGTAANPDLLANRWNKVMKNISENTCAAGSLPQTCFCSLCDRFLFQGDANPQKWARGQDSLDLLLSDSRCFMDWRALLSPLWTCRTFTHATELWVDAPLVLAGQRMLHSTTLAVMIISLWIFIFFAVWPTHLDAQECLNLFSSSSVLLSRVPSRSCAWLLAASSIINTSYNFGNIYYTCSEKKIFSAPDIRAHT